MSSISRTQSIPVRNLAKPTLISISGGRIGHLAQIGRAEGLEMKPSQRIVVDMPFREIWNEQGVVSTTKVRKLSANDIADLLRQSKVRKPLR